MNVAYFPGCSLHGISREYDRSVRLICGSLGVRLEEVEDWNCCGATAAHSLDHELTMGLNGRNLAQASRMNLDSLVTPCPGCFNRLKGTRLRLEATALRKKGAQPVKDQAADLPDVVNLLQFLVERIGLDRIAQPVKVPLKGLKLAAYYGCLTTRPRKIAGFDDPEQPVSMDRILTCLGAQTVLWSHKTECCGGPFAVSEVTVAVDLGRQVLDAARRAGAEAMAVACPMCQVNLDSRQPFMRGEGTYLPIIYFTQLVALAYGFSVRRTGLKRLLIDPLSMLKWKGLV